ncbi:MAG: hypothetical protein LC120_04880 [Bacteroidales bacterium]|nr:hypothetical protein [Bacteroidales bacterium]
MKTNYAQNCTFASPYIQADASACKRVVFLPTHPNPPTTRHRKTDSLTAVL